MKQYINYILASCLLVVNLSFISCSDDDDKDNNTILTDTSVYFENSGVNNYTIYNKGEGVLYTFDLDIRKAGKLSNKASVTLEVVMTSELNAYNAANGTDFVRLAPKNYEIETLNVSFDANENDVLRKVQVSFNIPEMDATETNKVLAIKISDASVSIDSKKAICIIRPQISQSLFQLESPQINTIDVDIDNAENFNFDISTILEIDKNEWDVNLELEVDANYVATYNAAHGTNYVLPPSNSYVLETSKILAMGDKTVSFNLSGSTQYLANSCILPIRLKSSSRYDINKDEYFVLIFNVPQYTSELLSKATWSIVGFSSEEATGESNGANGKAKYAIDGNNNTFWHSQWQGAKPQPPHWLIIDMNDEFYITQIVLRQRGSGDNAPTKAGQFYLCDEYNPGSPELAVWRKIGDFELAAIATDQVTAVSRSKGRYLKVNITEVRSGDKTTSLAEIGAYGYQK